MNTKFFLILALSIAGFGQAYAQGAIPVEKIEYCQMPKTILDDAGNFFTLREHCHAPWNLNPDHQKLSWGGSRSGPRETYCNLLFEKPITKESVRSHTVTIYGPVQYFSRTQKDYDDCMRDTDIVLWKNLSPEDKQRARDEGGLPAGFLKD